MLPFSEEMYANLEFIDQVNNEALMDLFNYV